MAWNVPLPFNLRKIEEEPTSVVAYGPPGSGKTTELFLTLSRMICGGQHGVVVVERGPSAMRAYNDLRLKHPEWKLPEPVARLSLDAATIAEKYGGSMYTALMHFYQIMLASAAQGPLPFGAIMFDDWNEMMEEVYNELKAMPASAAPQFYGKGGGQNIFAIMDAFKVFHRQFISLGKRVRRAVGFTAHIQPPKIFEESGSPYFGQVKNPGGPKMPMGLGDQIVTLCGDADVVVEFAVEPPPPPAMPAPPPPPVPGAPPVALAPLPPLVLPSKAALRQIKTTLEERWFRKVRGFDIPPFVTVDIATGQGLYALLKKAGYPV